MSTAHNITHVTEAKVGGKHLSDAANEPSEISEAEWIAADLARNEDKATRRLARDVRAGVEEQVQRLRDGGLL